MVIAVIGMAAAFLLGAFVRAPFALFKSKEEKSGEEKPRDDEKAARILRQWSNLLDYTGESRGIKNGH